MDSFTIVSPSSGRTTIAPNSSALAYRSGDIQRKDFLMRLHEEPGQSRDQLVPKQR